ncbi:unnamed protein product [Clonostachys solani]|uniref:RNA binding protein Jsn1 n=1 Tax=Clonostachys solani TaxID=160281 RepID=A0A9N9Z5J5_9HYPO|nr:unnamed protein product [Clonostachys solani]
MSTSRSENFPLGFGSHPPSQPRSTSPSVNNSPVETPGAGVNRSPFGLTSGVSSAGIMSGNSRSGAGSPSHEIGGSSRLFSKRAREIQAQEGVAGIPLNPWGGPPTSGNSTPLRENIPESPTDGFPDFGQLPTPDSNNQPRRARAGTVPSRFPPGGPGPGHLPVPGLGAKSARNTPSQTPYNKTPSPGLEAVDGTSGSSALLSRLRAGSLPQRSQFAPLPGTISPFGPSIFSSWNPTGVGRERASTLASIASVPSNGPSSPSQSHFSREGGNDSDVHMRTLDYLGLAETPQQARAQIATPYMPNLDFARQASRIRSYSVNNKDVHADEYPDDEYEIDGLPVNEQHYAAALQDQLAATHAAIRNHNLAVQAFANQASSTRRRARTAGVLDAPGSHLMNSFLAGPTPGAANPLAAAELRLQEEKKFEDLPSAVAGLSLGRSSSRNAGLLGVEDQGLEGPTSALWLGNIPTSTTTSTLIEMFKSHGPIVSVRVLTHKNCGFVNFERVESAISAKANMNGKEIFPGASPIRINFAKPVSPGNTPGHDGAFPSPSPDPFAKGHEPSQVVTAGTIGDAAASVNSNGPPTPPALRDITADILEIVCHFGASETDRARISHNLQASIQFTSFIDEIPPIREPSHTRVHDAPKLRDIRKRIDNQTLSQSDIENAAVEMLPEIAELASDYLGNTVVQKLFEHCSDQIRDMMLNEIAPHMAEIGVHKNGTWAAQKIIDVCKTSTQMTAITDNLRPYTVPLFLDQYGNYVLQCCLKFNMPFNDFIFETMMSRMSQLSQGRFGARAMRACLESHHSTKEQQRMLAALIAIHSVHLATNQNGALLLTWYLDTCTFPQRRTVLAPRIIPYLVHLCTHKVAYLTVLKVVNQKAEPEARDSVLKALFLSPNDQVLEAILNDSNCGATLIFKVLTMPFFDEALRSQVVENVKNVLVRIKAQPNQGYKRLMDEVGLSTRNGGASRDSSAHPEQRQRPSSRQASGGVNGHQGQQGNPGNKSFYNQTNTSSNVSGFDSGFPQSRGDLAEASTVSSLPPFNPGLMYGTPGLPNLQQLSYQQNMLGRGAPSMNYNFPQVPGGYGVYPNGNPSLEQFRQVSNGSSGPPSSGPIPQISGGQASFPPPGFGVGMGGYGFGNVGGGMNFTQQDQGNSRRGRVSYPSKNDS